MKFTKPLDAILNTEAKTRILRFFCRTGAQWNGSQIAKEIGVTPAAAHSALRILNKEGLLQLHNMGKTHVYSLKEDNFIVSNLLKPLFAREDKALDAIITIIKRGILSSAVKRDITSVALFGSVNIREDRPTSDIDLAVVINNSKSKFAIEQLFGEIDTKTSRQFGNMLSPYIVTQAELRAKYKKSYGVIKNILKSHTLIYGKKLENLL
jgi:predicted nucleotidyltransferase